MKREFRVSYRRAAWTSGKRASRVYNTRLGAERHIHQVTNHAPRLMSPVVDLTVEHRDVPAWSEGWGDETAAVA